MSPFFFIALFLIGWPFVYMKLVAPPKDKYGRYTEKAYVMVFAIMGSILMGIILMIFSMYDA